MISRLSLINAAGVAAALGLALVAAGRGASPGIVTQPAATASLEIVALPSGGRGLRDATGHAVELRAYRRILAASFSAA